MLSLLVLSQFLTENCAFEFGVLIIASDKRNIPLIEEFFESSQSTLLQIKHKTIPLERGPDKIMAEICQNIVSISPNVLIYSLDERIYPKPPLILNLLNYLNIPVITIESKNRILKNNNEIRMSPTLVDEIKVLIKFLNQNNWTSVIYIHSNDQIGQFVLDKLKNATTGIKIRLELIVTLGLDNIRAELMKIKRNAANVVLGFFRKDVAKSVLEEGKNLNLFVPPYVWIVNEALINLPNSPDGLLSFGKKITNELELIKDSINILNYSFKFSHLVNKKFQRFNKCSQYSQNSLGILSVITKTNSVGFSGKIKFSPSGERTCQTLSLSNRQNSQLVEIGDAVIIDNNINLNINKYDILFPGMSLPIPRFNPRMDFGIPQNKLFRVIVKDIVPYVIKRLLNESDCLSTEIKCSFYHNLKSVTDYCCSGFMIDILMLYMNRLRIPVELRITTETFGTLNRHNNSIFKYWDGIIGDLVDDKVDAVFAPLYITTARGKYISFTIAFGNQEIVVAQNKKSREIDVMNFVEPFSVQLWIWIFTSVNIIALALFLFDKLAFYKWTGILGQVTFLSEFWLSWGIALNSGLGEGTPKGLAGHLMSFFWAFFTMFIAASYTAQLAAMLVIEQAEFSNIQKYGKPGVVFGKDRNPYISESLRSFEMLEIGKRIKRTYSSVEEGLAALSRKEIDGFILHKERLVYESYIKCNYTKLQTTINDFNLGIGLQINSTYKPMLDNLIKNLIVEHKIDELEKKWHLKFGKNNCSLQNKDMIGNFYKTAGFIKFI